MMDPKRAVWIKDPLAILADGVAPELLAPPGSNVIVQSSVTGSDWVSLATNNSASGIIELTYPLIFPDTNQPESQSTNRFYRAWVEP